MPNRGNAENFKGVTNRPRANRDPRQSGEVVIGDRKVRESGEVYASPPPYQDSGVEDLRYSASSPPSDDGDGERIELPLSRRVTQRPPKESVDDGEIIGLPTPIFIDDASDSDDGMIGLPSYATPEIPPPPPDEPWEVAEPEMDDEIIYPSRSEDE